MNARYQLRGRFPIDKSLWASSRVPFPKNAEDDIKMKTTQQENGGKPIMSVSEILVVALEAEIRIEILKREWHFT